MRHAYVMVTVFLIVFPVVAGWASEAVADQGPCPAGAVQSERDLPDKGWVSECRKPDGTLHGPTIRYWSNGLRRELVNYRDGKKDGLAIRWNEKGRRVETRTFSAGTPNGTAKKTEAHKKPAAERKATPEKNKKPQSKDGENKNPQPGKVKSAKAESAKSESTKSESVEALPTKGFSGPVAEKYANGKRKVRGRLKKGRRVGTWIWWYENGKKMKTVPYRRGAPNGVVRTYYDNGRRESAGRVKDSEKEGRWTFWRRNGKVWKRGRYV
ncbi:MAG: hypothetical protein GXP54_05140, partial [Deltaproteobacteria bacterium]|nr:hypothetical protein [Deltaproteobacteria bacterium]